MLGKYWNVWQVHIHTIFLYYRLPYLKSVYIFIYNVSLYTLCTHYLCKIIIISRGCETVFYFNTHDEVPYGNPGLVIVLTVLSSVKKWYKKKKHLTYVEDIIHIYEMNDFCIFTSNTRAPGVNSHDMHRDRTAFYIMLFIL